MRIPTTVADRSNAYNLALLIAKTVIYALIVVAVFVGSLVIIYNIYLHTKGVSHSTGATSDHGMADAAYFTNNAAMMLGVFAVAGYVCSLPTFIARVSRKTQMGRRVENITDRLAVWALIAYVAGGCGFMFLCGIAANSSGATAP